MIPFAEVMEGQRLQDLKKFRQYLVDTGAVKCLMKLYQHTKQHEMRLDNPNILKAFLGCYEEDGPDAEEATRVAQDNDTLRKLNHQLATQCQELEAELET